MANSKQSFFYIGVDEAGRGPLAGPVLACALVKLKTQDSKLKTTTKKLKLRDSKQLSMKRREQIFSALKKDVSFIWALGRVGEKVIDKINIFEATKLAMKRAVEGLVKKLKRQNVQKLSLRGGKIPRYTRDKLRNLVFKPKKIASRALKLQFECSAAMTQKLIPFLLIDGNFGINVSYPQKSIIRGDEKIPLIALASIIAKVERDRIMINYHKKYPQYNFAKHKGYGTKHHYQALKKHGPCILHRQSFRLI